MKKYIFLRLKIQDGENQYYSKSALALDKDADIQKSAKSYAVSFFGVKADKDGAWWTTPNGTLACKVDAFEIITEEEFNVLSKFI